MKKILIIGAGKSTSVLIDHLLSKAEAEDLFLKIGDIDLENAKKACGNKSRCEAFHLDVFNGESRENAVKNADIVISMLPARFHIEVAQACVKFKKNIHVNALYECLFFYHFSRRILFTQSGLLPTSC